MCATYERTSARRMRGWSRVCLRSCHDGGQQMALDLHDEPFYGKTPELRTYACRGGAKEGTTHFYRIATLYVLWRQVRVTLAMTYLLPEDNNLNLLQPFPHPIPPLSLSPAAPYIA